MIQVADNFNYRGKKPNFDRDSFDTLQDMKNYSENSLDDGHISYCKETDKRYKFNSNNQSDPTTGKWVEQHEAVPADEEDITEQNGTLQLANKTYDKQSFSGLGRVYLRKNIVGDKNVLTQAMINKANTIYVIQYDYDLKEASINIPENCVLQFDGGSLSNGNVIGNGTSIESSSKYVSILNVTLSGNWKINDGYPEWFGAIGDGIADDRNAIQTAVDNCNTVHFRNTKYKLGIIYYQAGQQGNLFISKNVKLLGDNTELILEGKGQIFTRKGYSEHSPVYDKFKVNPKELIVENVNYLSNIIKVNNAHRFNVGDTILIRGEDSRINTDYEECDAWDINTIKQINSDNSIELMSPIAFNIDITKCNRSGGISKPTMNGCIIKIDITHLVIDSFKFKENQLSNVFDFQYCTNIKLSNIEVIHKGVASLSTNKDSEISKENPLIVTLFFTPLYHLTQILDGDKNWEINNGGYTKDIISINNYPFAYLENSNIVNNYRETLNKNIGNTSNRPIEASKGFQYFDTTINKPIFWDGSKWIDATGATV